MFEDALAYNLIHRFNVGDALRRSAARYPDKTAIRFAGAELSYRAFDALANRIAHALEAAGVGRGDRVGWLGLNSPDFAATFFACGRLGAVFVPINALLKGHEIDDALVRARVTVLVVDPLLLGQLNLAGEVVQRLEARFVLGPPDGPIPAGFQSWAAALGVAPDTPVERWVDNEDAATILFTSGTTALPKAVVNTHLNYYAALIAALHDLGMNHRHRVLLCLPLFHSAGLYFLFSSIAAGTTITLLPRIEVPAVLAAIPRDRITVVSLPATVWVGLDQLPDIDAVDFSSLETAIVFQYLPTDVFQRWMRRIPNATWISYWGQTEMIPLGASTRPGDLPERLMAPDPVGIPHLPLELRIVDDDMNDVPPGTVGEMVTRGPSCTPGYLDDAEATATLFRGGWLHTGDMAFRDADGFLYFVDRKKDMIKTGGENVSSQEVEEVLARHPKVAEVAVFGLPHPYWIEMVSAAVVLKPGEQATDDEVLAFARERMAHFKVPKRVFFVEDLPRSPSGKVLKRALQERFQSEVVE